MKQSASWWLALLAGMAIQMGGCGGHRTPTESSTEKLYGKEVDLAAYYRDEAMMLRRKAEDMAGQAEAYRLLFGENSDWVSGARLLTEFYQRAAAERDELADRAQSRSK
jgi:hypothetical protein